MEFIRQFTVTIKYTATTGFTPTPDGPTRHVEPREWSFVAEEICEEDAIWEALRAFRREEVRTWDGWPRDIHSVAVTWKDEG